MEKLGRPAGPPRPQTARSAHAHHEPIPLAVPRIEANGFSVGLPAELAVRRQQYEYYRDRLLTFKEATV